MPNADVFETLGYLFYIVNPNRTSFETHEEVPDYTVQVVPYFATLFLIEQCILKAQRRKTMRINDAVGSMSQGILDELMRFLLKGWQYAAYIYIYTNWRIVTLPWNSLWTWWICFLCVDFAYYWAHRASHEINFLWAAHQVHHSSEDYNLSTALRQSVFQSYFLTVFYYPMALAIPPSVYLVHTQFNLLYQFWIHTEVVKSLGPLEYVFNTASHHRVHHGRNRYCIDKNYGGTLIIWDRIFGTFEAENEGVVYGLTHPLNSFQPFYVQLCHFQHIWNTFWEIKGLKNKLSVIFKGPGWVPGTPWHGDPADIPDVKKPVEKYDPYVPGWCKIYIVLHFVVLLLGYIEIMEIKQTIPPAILYSALAFEVLSVTTLGIILEGRPFAPWIELFRCLVYFAIDLYFIPHTRLPLMPDLFNTVTINSIRILFISSILSWLWICLFKVNFSQSNKIK